METMNHTAGRFFYTAGEFADFCAIHSGEIGKHRADIEKGLIVRNQLDDKKMQAQKYETERRNARARG